MGLLPVLDSQQALLSDTCLLLHLLNSLQSSTWLAFICILSNITGFTEASSNKSPSWCILSKNTHNRHTRINREKLDEVSDEDLMKRLFFRRWWIILSKDKGYCPSERPGRDYVWEIYNCSLKSSGNKKRLNGMFLQIWCKVIWKSVCVCVQFCCRLRRRPICQVQTRQKKQQLIQQLRFLLNLRN